MKNMICIVCPKGCHLSVDTQNGLIVTGNACERGAEYARAELTAPVRTLTSTVCVSGGIYSRCPVKSDKPLPKGMIFETMYLLDTACIQAPARRGDIVLANIMNTGVNIVTTRNVDKYTLD